MTDTNKTQLLAREVLDIIYELPDKIVEKIILAWEDGTKIDKYNVTKITGVSGQKIYRLSRLLEQHGDHGVLSHMFAMGLLAKSKSISKKNDMEIVWTGPSLNTEMDVGNTKQVIERMLKSANDKVTIVDYRITSKAESIVEELNKCLKEGVDIDLIVDNHRANERELRKCFSEISLARPRIFIRKEKESKYYKMHAKVIIIDDVQMLIGSANLTKLGTEDNFELGVLINGPIVRTMLKLLNLMIADKYFEEVE